MWPFKRTLSERYSKLVKLIKSIDSHFQLTEDKEDSLRLHLPNYKGNQPMDFHIYMMEPFLFISFVTEIEGEKISCVNNFPKDTDQQDMFNVAMSNNLNKIHQILEDKYSEDGEEKKDDGKEETDENHNSVTSNNDSSGETWGLRDYYDFNESFKKHALTIMILRRGIEFRYFASKNDYTPKWSYNIDWEKIQSYNCPSGAEPLVWIMKHYDNREDFCWLLEVLDEQIAHLWVESMEEPEKLIEEIQKYVPQFKLKNNPQDIKMNLGWSWIDIHAILHFIDYCSCQQNKLLSTPEEVKPLQECTTIEDISRLYWSDYTKEQHSQKENNKEVYLEDIVSDSIVVQSWSLLDFAKTHGKMKRIPSSSHINSETGEEELSAAYCIFVHPTNKDEQGKPVITAIVAFSSELGELSVDEIVQQKSDLMVVKYASGDYALIHKEADTVSTVATTDDYTNAWVDEFGVKYSADKKKLLQAPKEIVDYSIRKGTIIICDYAFSDGYATQERALERISIPDGVIAIGNMAFFECKKLGNLIMPDSVRSIGWKAFFSCGFSSIVIPSHVNIIGVCAFGGNSNLCSIVVDKSNKHFNSHNNCNAIIESLTNTLIIGCSSTVIPDSVTKIGENAFLNCQGLTTISIPSNVVSIEDNAFSYCSDIRSIKVEKGNVNYDSRDNCNALIETRTNTLVIGCPYTIIPKTISKIGTSAFKYSGSPKNIIIPNSVRIISASAFENCTELLSVIIPENVSIIEEKAFYGCKKLYSIKISDGIKDIGERAFFGCVELSTITIPKSVKKIAGSTFENCIKLNSVNISDGIEEIGDDAFSNCENLISIEIPKSVRTIGDSAFRHCIRISTVDIPEGVIEIGKEAFSWCINLKSVNIADSVERIGPSAFDIGNGSPSFYIHVGTKNKFEKMLPGYANRLYEREYSENLITKVSEDDLLTAWMDEHGVLYSADKKRLLYVPDNIEEYSVAEGTEEIGDYAFANIEFEDVDYNYIMENNLDIHDFERYTSKLVSVYIPNSVVRIGKGIFDYCTKLAIINIPDGATEIFKQLLPDYEDIFVEGDISTIVHSKELEEVWIDKDGVKYSKDKRKLLKAPGGLTKYAINPHTKVICDGAFFDCANLKEIHLPENIAIIGKYAFYGCDSLSGINLPKAVLKIGEKAFDGCKKLNSLFIPRMEQGRLCKILPSHFDKFKEPMLNSVIDEKGVVYDNDYQILHFNTLPLDTYSIKSGVKTIDDFAFKPEEWKKDAGTSLLGLSLPNSVVLIGAGAFAFNQCLATINIPPKAALSYDFNPFAGCSELHTIKWKSERSIKEGTLVYNEDRTALIACLPWHYIDGVVKSWSLMDFAKQYGKMQVGEFANKATGVVFKSCIFTSPNDGTRVFVAFSTGIGELTPQEIVAMKNELQVVQLESGNYSLCKGKTIIDLDPCVEIPYGIKVIADKAFYNNKKLQEIILPASVDAIGQDAFEGCSSIRVIYIPKGTMSKFKMIIPKWKDLIVERADMLPF